MSDKMDFTGMPLAAAVQAWMDGQGWEDEIKISEERIQSQVGTMFDIDGQAHRLYIETREEASRFLVFLYSPYKCPPARMDAMARILNRINLGSSVGRFACEDDQDPNPVQFSWSIDVDGTQPSPEQVGVMVDMGVRAFSTWGGLLAAVALTKRPAEELWKDWLAEQEAAQTDSEDGPTEL